MIGWSMVLSGIGVATGVLIFLRVVANHLAVLEHRVASKAASAAGRTADEVSQDSPTRPASS